MCSGLMDMAFSTPVRIVEPPGCKAQSKSAADLFSIGRLERDATRSLNVGSTTAAANFGTRGESTTFHPANYQHHKSLYKTKANQPSGSTSKPRSCSVSGIIR